MPTLAIAWQPHRLQGEAEFWRLGLPGDEIKADI